MSAAPQWPASSSPARPIIRIVEAGLGPEAQVRLIVSGRFDLAKLRSVWVSSGASVATVGERLHATTTVPALARAAGRAFGADQGRRLEGILRDAIGAWSQPPPPLQLGRGLLLTDQRPLIMGVINVTPDSFSGDGVLADGDPHSAGERALRLLDEGADVIDVGGESTRPGAKPVDLATELERVVPVVERVAASDAVVSIDTTKAEVAQAALAAGARIVNDVSGAQDPDLLAVTAEADAAYVLMHSRATPADMQDHADYEDVVAEVYEFLASGLQRVVDAGISIDRVIVDPGLGFAKTAAHNLDLLRSTRQLTGLGRPVLVGASRKSFLGALLDEAPATDRLEGSLACAVLAVAGGAAMVRVHDVEATVRAVRVASAVTRGTAGWSRSVTTR